MRLSSIISALGLTVAMVQPPLVVSPVLLTVPPLIVGEEVAPAPGGSLLLRMLTEGLFVGSQR